MWNEDDILPLLSYPASLVQRLPDSRHRNTESWVNLLHVAIRSGCDESAILISTSTNILTKGDTDLNALEEVCYARNRYLFTVFFKKAKLTFLPAYLYRAIYGHDDFDFVNFIGECVTFSVRRQKMKCEFCEQYYWKHHRSFLSECGAVKLWHIENFAHIISSQKIPCFPEDQKSLDYFLRHGVSWKKMCKDALLGHRTERTIHILFGQQARIRKTKLNLEQSTIDLMVREINHFSVFDRIANSNLKPQTESIKLMRKLLFNASSIKHSKLPPCTLLEFLARVAFRFTLRHFPSPIQELIMEYNKMITRSQLFSNVQRNCDKQ
jgi:hypothetical protein